MADPLQAELRPEMPMPAGTTPNDLDVAANQALGSAFATSVTPDAVHKAYSLPPEVLDILGQHAANIKKQIPTLEAAQMGEDANPAKLEMGLWGPTRKSMLDYQQHRIEVAHRQKKLTQLYQDLEHIGKLQQGMSPEEIEMNTKLAKSHYDDAMALSKNAAEVDHLASQKHLNDAQAGKAFSDAYEGFQRAALLQAQAADVPLNRKDEHQKMLNDAQKQAMEGAKSWLEYYFKQQDVQSKAAEAGQKRLSDIQTQNLDIAKQNAENAKARKEMVYPQGMGKGVLRYPNFNPQPIAPIPAPPQVPGVPAQMVNPQMAAMMNQLSQGAQGAMPPGPGGQPAPATVPPPAVGTTADTVPAAQQAPGMEVPPDPARQNPMAQRLGSQRVEIIKRARAIGASNHNLSPAQAWQMALKEAQQGLTAQQPQGAPQ